MEGQHKHGAGDEHGMRGFIRREGYLSDESLMEVGWYTAAASAALCAANSSCCGFTLRGTSPCVSCDSDKEFIWYAPWYCTTTGGGFTCCFSS